MEQRLVTSHDLNSWSELVNDYLKNGWKVVPGTMSMTAACSNGTQTYSSQRAEAYAIVVEKP